MNTADGVVLAVDGGNSKADVALVDRNGALLSIVRGPGSSPHELGVSGSVEVLARLFERAAADAGFEDLPVTASAHVLIAGVDLPEEREAVHNTIERLDWSERLVVDTDMPALLRAGSDRGWGIAVVCGAGINGFGRAPDGREARFLSLGRISGDWGGGPEVGLEGLAAAARAADGRGPRTVLESAVSQHFGLSDPLAVSRAIHVGEIPEERVAELAAVVLEHWADDAVAAEIAGRLVDEAVAFARVTLSRLELTDADPDVVLGGRLLLRLSPQGLIDTIAERVRAVAPSANVFLTPSEPIVGAALLGLDVLGADAAAHDRARAELDSAVGSLATSA